MAGEIDFLPFAVGANANVITQPTYVTLPAVGSGFASGIAQSAQLNKVWRQSSLIATVIARFIDQQTGRGAIDDGTTDTLLANLTAAIASTSITGVSNNAVANYTYSQTDASKLIIRATVSGTTTMSDTLPFPALPAFSNLRILNADVTGLLVITPANGAALDGKAVAAIIGPMQSIEVISDGSNYHSLGRPGRTKCGSNLILQVAASGNDNANGITGSFATIQAAVSALYNNYDLNGYSAAIGIASGTYSAGATLSGKPLGHSPGAVAVNGAGPTSTYINASQSGFLVEEGGSVIFGQMSVSGGGTTGVYQGSGRAISAGYGSNVGLNQGMAFGVTSGYHLEAGIGSNLTTGGNPYTITGGAQIHWSVGVGARIIMDGSAITLTGTPNFSSAFGVAFECGVISAAGTSFSGSATGPRYTATTGGQITTNGGSSSLFPGSSAGATSIGGFYS